jgi:hypothetical protein
LRVHHGVLLFIGGTLNLRTLNPFSKKVKPILQKRIYTIDQIEYNTTRHQTIKRQMHIPHPVPYCHFVKEISKNWDELNHICINDVSKIRPRRHSDDRIFIMGEYEDIITGRILVMDKESLSYQTKSMLDMSIGSKYLAKADIANFFPSIYTHSIPWALVGIREAKSKTGRDHYHEYFNKLDFHQRLLKRSETIGVPIGPATSNIVSEIILNPIDKELTSNDFKFVRYIDDYQCFCKTEEDAQNFLIILENLLNRFLLKLNSKKIMIEKLPVQYTSNWVVDLNSHIPNEFNSRTSIYFMEYVLKLQKKHPEESVLKYAARVLARFIRDNNENDGIIEIEKIIIKYFLNLAFEYPVIIPILVEVIKNSKVKVDEKGIFLLLQEHIRYRRSDAICWIVFLLGLKEISIPDSIAKKILDSEDCMSMGALISINQHVDKVEDFVKIRCKNGYKYDCDKYWILIYHLGYEIKECEEYYQENHFDILRSSGIRFILPIEEYIEYN